MGGQVMHGAVKVFTVIALLSIPTVMYGGYSLLRLLVARKLNEFQLTYFRAGHAHAGVLLVLSLVVLDIVDRSGLGQTAVWIIGVLLVVGVLAQSGGMFVHMAVGSPGTWSKGNTLTTVGALLLAVALVATAVGVITA
jgi:hypothetical protein